ncbi:hypothetical protein [Ferrovibrio sp.]|uniref:hypothetical protein n=1 Tax=Ferrovibrio sp. TaxID=1917215 RepID=UPI003D1384A5
MNRLFARGRMLTLAATAALLAGLALAPQPAAADSFSFGYSSGPWHSRPWYDNHYRHGPRHGYRDSYAYRGGYWGPPAYRPRVVVVQPPPVRYYAPPPPVVYAPAPYGGPNISAVPASPVYQAQNGQYCREYQATVVVAGVPQASYGTACLMPDGAWRVVN